MHEIGIISIKIIPNLVKYLLSIKLKVRLAKYPLLLYHQNAAGEDAGSS